MRKLLLLLPLLALSALPASAQLSNARGWCENGGQQVITSGLTSTTTVQASYPQCTVSVSVHGGGTATIYSTGSSTPLSNPFTATTNGQWLFYAANGEYDITLSGAGFPSPVTYSDVFIGASGGGGGGGTPALPLNSLQYNLNNNFGGAQGLTTPDGNSIIIKGIDPFSDITAWGARAVGGTPVASGVSCAASTTQTFGADPASFGFAVNDGVTIYGCGTSNTMSTPGTVTVVPSEAAGETGTEYVVNSPTGSSTYQYCIFARDKFGAVTPCSATTTITTGLASLGLQRVNLASLTRSNDQVTVVTATNQLVALAATEIESTASRVFNGWFSVGSITNATTFVLNATPTDTRAQGWQAGDVSSVGSGGTLAYYLGNHLAWTLSTGGWEYYVCAKRPGDGALHLIGVTKPSFSPGYQDVQFDDWGSPYMDGQSYPSYITNANCTGSATNDPLTTTITAINSGAHTITTANAATQTLGSTTAIFDDGPAILAAATAQAASAGNGGTVYIPPAPSSHSYPVNSYLKLPNFITMWQAGYLAANETIEVGSGVNWDGSWGNFAVPQFGFNAGATIQAFGTFPVLYIDGPANTFHNLLITTAGNVTNGGTLIVADNASFSTFRNVSFSTGGGGATATDYLSSAFIWRDTTGTVANMIFDTVLFSGGPDQVSDKSWQCLFCMMPGETSGGASQNVFYEFDMQNSFWNRRGIAVASQGGGGTFEVDNMYRQGGITPMFDFQSDNICTNCGNVLFTNEAQDTEGEPVLANLYVEANTSLPIGVNVVFNNVAGANSLGPLISGTRPAAFKLDGYNYFSTVPTPNRDTSVNGFANTFTYAPYATTGSYAPIAGGLQTFTEPTHIPSGHSFYFDLQPPTSLAGTVAAGGSVPVGTWYYAVNSTGADGGETVASLPTSLQTTTSGNQTVNLTWTNPVGSASSNIYRCTGASCIGADGNASNLVPWTRLAQHQTGASYSDTAASGTNEILPEVTGTGATVVNKSLVSSPLFQCPETTAPSGVPGFDLLYCDSTADRWKAINNNGSAQTIAFLSDITSAGAWSGVTAGANSNAGTFSMSGNTWDAHAAAHSSPAVSGLTAAIPATCTVGEEFFATDATAGQNMYYCTATNTWTQQLNSGAAGATTTLNNLATTAVNADINPGVTNSINLGSASKEYLAVHAQSIDGLTPTALSTGWSLAGGTTSKTLTVINTLTLAGTDGSTYTGPNTSTTLTGTIASGTTAMATGAIGSGGCASAVTATATGATAGDNLLADDNASDLSGVTGYGVSVGGTLMIYKRITTNTVSFTVCNSTGGTITPGALTLQWRVVR